jgi:hypothetical protein
VVVGAKGAGTVLASGAGGGLCYRRRIVPAAGARGGTRLLSTTRGASGEEGATSRESRRVSDAETKRPRLARLRRKRSRPRKEAKGSAGAGAGAGGQRGLGVGSMARQMGSEEWLDG